MEQLHRREWLKKSALAAMGLGVSLRSLANEEGITRSFGNDKGLINLGSNENPYGLSPKAKEAIISILGEANRYPFNVPSLSSFKKELAAHYHVTEDMVLVTAGSGEGLNLLARHFSKGNIIAATPTFGILPNTAKRIGTAVKEIPLTKEKVHDLPAMLSAIDAKTNLVYVVNPANPGTTMIKPAALESFCNEASAKTSVLVDEAYIDFLDAPDNESMIKLVQNNPNILVIRTFSKIYAMAGMRVGFVIAHPSVISQLEKDYFTQSQSCVSIVSMAAAIASLNDNAHTQLCKQKNEEARSYAFNQLKQLGIACIPSFTNFLFFPLGNYKGDFAKDMMEENFIVRSSVYNNEKWSRVSVGTMEEMKQFIMVAKPKLKT